MRRVEDGPCLRWRERRCTDQHVSQIRDEAGSHFLQIRTQVPGGACERAADRALDPFEGQSLLRADYNLKLCPAPVTSHTTILASLAHLEAGN